MDFRFIPSEINAADIMSKHWGYNQIWTTLQPIMFYRGDTADLFDKDSTTHAQENTDMDEECDT